MNYNILLGLTGSVASTLYKKLILELEKLGNVELVLTENSKKFIKLDEIKNNVYTDFDEWDFKEYHKDDLVLHIEAVKRSQILVIAPASANTIAKLANGICDNLLTSIALAWDYSKPIVVCPAMNTRMYLNPITQKNIQALRDIGMIVIDPQTKRLACGDEGIGGLCDISEIRKYLISRLRWQFPLNFCNAIPIMPHPGAFGMKRRDNHLHTGIDLYTNDNEPVYAVEDGKIVCIEAFTGKSDNSPWWNDTECILVAGNSGTVCYGELIPLNSVRYCFENGNTFVKKGSVIGNVKRVLLPGKERPDIPGHMPNMLHLELYKHGTIKPSNGFSDDLLDPTEYILKSDGCGCNMGNIVTYDKYNPDENKGIK